MSTFHTPFPFILPLTEEDMTDSGTPTRLLLLAIVGAMPNITRPQMEEAVPVCMRTIRSHLLDLEKLGLVSANIPIHPQPFRYTVTDKGRHLLTRWRDLFDVSPA